VRSLAQPGGNATGANFFAIEIEAKRLDLMHELLPKEARIAVLINPANVRPRNRCVPGSSIILEIDLACDRKDTT
jgi:ABC-type uncharacterized transport system substrate-binding protein